MAEMNRPKKSDYWVFIEEEHGEVFHHLSYEKDLEKYCDELEEAKTLVKVYTDDERTEGGWVKAEVYNKVVEEIRKLKKSLDKACNHLHELECVVLGGKEHAWTFEQWKEWALKDE